MIFTILSNFYADDDAEDAEDDRNITRAKTKIKNKANGNNNKAHANFIYFLEHRDNIK